MLKFSNTKVHARLTLHRKLHDHYQLLLGDIITCHNKYRNVPREQLLKQEMVARNEEGQWLEDIQHRCETELKSLYTCIPHQNIKFVEWIDKATANYEQVQQTIFEYLSNEASLTELAAYICLEDLVDSRFDDIVALSQVGITNMKAKMALANNYWDEMGNGKFDKIHGTMFQKCVNYYYKILKDDCKPNVDVKQLLTNWQVYQNSNILLCYSLRREYATRLLGCLCILEDTAAYRFKLLVQIMKNLNIDANVYEYQKLHAQLDEEHGRELLYDVCLPLITDAQNHGCEKSFLHEICMGILTRIIVAKDYYEGVDDVFKQVKNHIV